ncbi:MAG: apolipoprotein N-acyltransferase, partial [Nocardioidaceae bacterium]
MLLARSGAAALAGAAVALAFEPYRWVVLAPVGIAVLTLLCVGRGPRTSFWLGTVFGTAFMAVLLPWLQVIGVFAWLPLAAFEGLFYGLAGLAVGVLTRRPRPTTRSGASGVPGWPLLVACAWVLLEALRSSVPFGGFPWGRLAFATADTPVAPMLAYVGSAGVSLLVALTGTTLAWAVLRVRQAPVAAVAGAVAVGALASAGSLLPWQPVTGEEPTVRVASVQGNVPGEGLEAFAERRAVLDNHVAATLDLARRIESGAAARPDLVLWPENSSDIDPYADAAARAAVSGTAAAVGAPLLMGAVVGDRVENRWRNRAIVWSPSGTPGAFYDKTHPVPFGEYIPLRAMLAPLVPALDQIASDMIPGVSPGLLRVGPARVGVLMCFEVAYDGLLRDLVRGGADVIVVPTNNATYIGTGQVAQQFAMSRLRAIETGRSVVVASTNGISGIVAPDGSVVQRAPQRRTVVLEQEVVLVGRDTPATVLGAWPERVASAVAALALLGGL